MVFNLTKRQIMTFRNVRYKNGPTQGRLQDFSQGGARFLGIYNYAQIFLIHMRSVFLFASAKKNFAPPEHFSPPP